MVNNLTRDSIAEAREIMESFDESGAMTIGFDRPTYTLTAEQMVKIASALYLADCLVYDVENENSEKA
jgi:hypothetical protein